MTTNLPDEHRPFPRRSRVKLLLFAAELGFISILLAIWLLSESVKASTNLLVLFFYSFPSEFLVGLVPHEPVLLYFGRFYTPLTVTVVAIVSTVMAEAINYSVFGYVADTRLFRKMSAGRLTQKVIDLFNKWPFTAIWIAGFTPIPFYPFRFLVVLARYPISLYLLAVFLSRAPRFYILAFIGDVFRIPGWVLAVLFVILIIAVNVQVIRTYMKKESAG